MPIYPAYTRVTQSRYFPRQATGPWILKPILSLKPHHYLLPLLYPPFHLLSPSNVTAIRSTGSWRAVLKTTTGTGPLPIVIFFAFVHYCCCRVGWPTCNGDGHPTNAKTWPTTTSSPIHSKVRFAAKCPWDHFRNLPPPSGHLLRPRT